MGTMVGVGWLVVMDDCCCAAGRWARCWVLPLVAHCCFPIGWVYGRLVAAMPDAAGEIALHRAAFSARSASPLDG